MKFIEDIELSFIRNLRNSDFELVKPHNWLTQLNGNMIMPFLESELLIKVNRSSNEVLIPKKMYVDSAGHDLFANESIKVCAGSRALVTVDLRMAIPKGFFGRISPRSGLAVNHGIVAFNGTIDAGYRGIIYVLLFNFSKDDNIAEKGNRVAQIIFQKYENVCFLEDTLDFTSERGVKAFGSSGL